MYLKLFLSIIIIVLESSFEHEGDYYLRECDIRSATLPTSEVDFFSDVKKTHSEVRINPIISSDELNDTRHTTPAISRAPHFAPDSPTIVTAAVGNPAHIPCKARSLGAKSVSWIRHRDLHMLTVGAFPFTNDERFTAHRDPSSGDWVLVIRRPETTDSGLYECSISTKPVITHTVRLNVVVPAAEMLGGAEVFLDNGSALNLTCVVKHTPVPPEFVLWYHRDELVNYGGRGHGVDVETAHSGSTTRSSLLVSNATQKDSGKYTCQPANAGSASVIVHVLKSETPAAMQTTNGSRHATVTCWWSVLLLLLPAALCFSVSFPAVMNSSTTTAHKLVAAATKRRLQTFNGRVGKR